MRRISYSCPCDSTRSRPSQPTGRDEPSRQLDGERLEAVEHAANESREGRLAGLVGAVEESQSAAGDGERKLLPNAEPPDLNRLDFHAEAPSAAAVPKSFLPTRCAWAPMAPGSASEASARRRAAHSGFVGCQLGQGRTRTRREGRDGKRRGPRRNRRASGSSPGGRRPPPDRHEARHCARRPRCPRISDASFSSCPNCRHDAASNGSSAAALPRNTHSTIHAFSFVSPAFLFQQGAAAPQ